MMVLTDDQLTVLRDACYDESLDGDECIDLSYSGRGMYGKTCVGLRTDSVREAVAVLVKCATNYGSDGGDELAEEMAARLTTDSMGMGVIVYFPGITWEDED
jgi:hypothetical protein